MSLAVAREFRCWRRLMGGFLSASTSASFSRRKLRNVAENTQHDSQLGILVERKERCTFRGSLKLSLTTIRLLAEDPRRL